MELTNQMSNNSIDDSSEVNDYPRSEKIIIFAICASIAFPIVDSLANRYFNIEFWDSLVTKGVYFGSLFLALIYSFKRFKSMMIIFPAFILLLWVISFLFFPANQITLISEISEPLFLQAIPLFIITLAVRNYSKLWDNLKITSIIMLICALFYVSFLSSGFYEISYMEFSYSFSFAAVFLIINAFNKHTIINFTLALIPFIIILSYGARGTLIAIILAVLVYFLFRVRFTIKTVFSFIALLIVGVGFYLNFQSILIGALNLLSKINIKSRTLAYMLSDELLNSSGRDTIAKDAIKSIEENYLAGTGMGGDRVALGTYTHNFFTEIGVQYGVILGLIFLIGFLFYILKAFFSKNKDELFYIFFISFFSVGFMKLMFSSSYLLEPVFFMMIALAINISKNRNKNKILNSQIDEKAL